MTSARKIAANRANSRRSTGPKSPKGKSRAAKNARRHGLSLPVALSPTLSKEAEDLAQEIAGENPNSKILEAARLLADAQIDLERISRVRYDILGQYRPHLNATSDEDASVVGPPGAGGGGLQASEQVRCHLLEQLLKIDRYEMRARSKRKLAKCLLEVELGAKRRAESQAQ